VTFSSPSWRSLNHLKGSLNHPKKVTLNHLVFVVLLVSSFLAGQLDSLCLQWGPVDLLILVPFFCSKAVVTIYEVGFGCWRKSWRFFLLGQNLPTFTERFLAKGRELLGDPYFMADFAPKTGVIIHPYWRTALTGFFAHLVCIFRGWK